MEESSYKKYKTWAEIRMHLAALGIQYSGGIEVNLSRIDAKYHAGEITRSNRDKIKAGMKRTQNYL